MKAVTRRGLFSLSALAAVPTAEAKERDVRLTDYNRCPRCVCGSVLLVWRRGEAHQDKPLVVVCPNEECPQYNIVVEVGEVEIPSKAIGRIGREWERREEARVRTTYRNLRTGEVLGC